MRTWGAEDGDIDYAERALASAKETQPRTMRWTGGIIVSVAIVNEIVPPPTAPQFFATLLTFGSLLYGLGRVLSWESVPPRLVQISYCASIVTLFIAMLLMYRNRPVGWDFAYLTALVAVFGPLTFGWIPFMASGAIMVAATVWTLQTTATPHGNDWIIALVAAFAMGAYSLDLRLHLLREVAEAEHARELLVQTDALTGLLNRRGLTSRLETVWAGAQRRAEAVNVAFVDIVGLKTANDSHGHDFGDRVIVEVARAIRETVRADDLVARWGGDEFVVVAKGEVSSAEALQSRVVATLKMRSVAFEGRWHGEVSVGTAAGAPDACAFDELLEKADQAMYASRHHRDV